MDTNPLLDSILAANDEWTSKGAITIGSARYDAQTNSIFLKTLPGVEHEYQVPLEECQTASHALDWIYQLNEKSWCDGQKLKDFLECLGAALATKDIEVRRLPCKHDLESQ
jgi:hypothetical protein